MSYETVCEHCKTKLVVNERPMGVPGGQEVKEGYCPLCGDVVAKFITDGFISVKLTDQEHKLMQSIFTLSRFGHPSQQQVISDAANRIAVGFVKRSGDDLSIPEEVQQALVNVSQPLKI